MYGFTNETIDLAAIRERLAKMRNEDLEEYDRVAAFMASRSDRETWRVQLQEARAKWRRRSGAGWKSSDKPRKD